MSSRIHTKISNSLFIFSQPITLENNYTKATGLIKNYGMVFVDGIAFRKGSSIKFRIDSIGSVIF